MESNLTSIPEIDSKTNNEAKNNINEKDKKIEKNNELLKEEKESEKNEKKEEININIQKQIEELKDIKNSYINENKESKSDKHLLLKNKKQIQKESKSNFFEINKEKLKLLISPLSLKDKTSIQKSILNHIEHSLGIHNIDIKNDSLFYSTSLSIKDILSSRINTTENYIIKNNCKKVHYMSIEFFKIL